ncbi:methyltransferase N6AMT1 [Nasonia vitripennis]|uniref:Methyltransferase HEMK2 n=1 Tax=Nasonia vitripennis TaxID=7425 RepID=A0A7M7PVY7_NASVI|nr:methyltransferase N6AMT1 [Nasonia vitripennis]XP_031776739.2 methyltransferase N6AMT1 [Nasonia vitripennis]XP_032452114.1 methyltransferase N6AMT1 [Nasonia vitripennis]
METPIVNLTDADLESVYEPSEDSFLVIDALEMDLQQFESSKPAMCLEIGIGSGVVITALAMALQKYCFSYFLGIDINPQACKVTRKTCAINKVDIETVQMDLLSSMCRKNIFDIIIFNPPYVVTEPLEVLDDRFISKTWAGGHKGRQVMDRLFPLIPQLLSENGLFYLLVIKENEPHDIIQLFESLNMTGTIVAERKIRGEHLHVLRFKRKRALE